jgi:hypothetical protein
MDIRGIRIGGSQIGFGSKWSPFPFRLGRPQILRIKLLTGEILGPIGSSHLSSLLDHLDRTSSLVLRRQLCRSRAAGTYGISELTEMSLKIWILDCQLPFILVSPDQSVHFGIEVFADPKIIMDDDPSELLNTAIERFDPRCCTLELLGCADVEHQLLGQYRASMARINIRIGQ